MIKNIPFILFIHSNFKMEICFKHVSVLCANLLLLFGRVTILVQLTEFPENTTTTLYIYRYFYMYVLKRFLETPLDYSLKIFKIRLKLVQIFLRTCLMGLIVT